MAVLPSPDATLLVLVQLAVILAVAKALGALAARLGFTAVVGELFTGFVLGPSVLGAAFPRTQRALFPLGEGEPLGVIALLGLLLLLVLTGLEVDTALIARRLRPVALIAAAGLVVPFLLGAAVGLALPDAYLAAPGRRVVFALFLATALSISAIPVIARILLDLRILDRPLGQVTIAAAMVIDVAGWVVLSVVTGLARGGPVEPGLLLTVLAALGAVLLGSFTLGQWLVDGLLPRLADATGAGGQLSFLIVGGLAAAAVTLWAGLEPALGAFIVGLLVARSGALSEPARTTFESMTLGLFAPLFFAVAGLRADLALLVEPRVLLLGAGLVVVASVGKFVGVYGGARLAGFPHGDGLSMGIGLNARGAIEIAIATIGLEFGILTPELYTVVLGVAVVTTVMTPPLLRWTLRREFVAP